MSATAEFRARFDAAHEHGSAHHFTGLELLATAVVLIEGADRIGYVNPAAENLLGMSRKLSVGHRIAQLFGEASPLASAIDKARRSGASYVEQDLELTVGGQPALRLSCTVTAADVPGAEIVIELRPIDQQLRIAREERQLARPDQPRLERDRQRRTQRHRGPAHGGSERTAHLTDHGVALKTNRSRARSRLLIGRIRGGILGPITRAIGRPYDYPRPNLDGLPGSPPLQMTDFDVVLRRHVVQLTHPFLKYL